MNEVFWENLITYGTVIIITAVVLFVYLRKQKKVSHRTKKKIKKARELGFHEPVSLHPVINYDICIGSGACVTACPEHDVLGMVNGRAHTINASRCVGHGACFHACPLQAITLVIGTEKRGVELPHVSPEYETNVPGIFIAGELGGMGLIKNAVEQGRLAVQNIAGKLNSRGNAQYDVAIIGAGPAGISATLQCVKLNLKYVTLEQDTLGGTVYSFPRKKIVMTSPMDLPLYGKVKLTETSKDELLELWKSVLEKYNISIRESEKVENIENKGNIFLIKTNKREYTSKTVLLTIGRRGSPRKLGVKGEGKPKVFYRLLDPEIIQGEDVLVVGGGDSAVESAMLLAEQNKVTISYRGEAFKRIKPNNFERLNKFLEQSKIEVLFNSNVKEIKDESVVLAVGKETREIKNTLVYVFIGGLLPTNFLEQIGIKITKKFGEAVMKH